MHEWYNRDRFDKNRKLYLCIIVLIIKRSLLFLSVLSQVSQSDDSEQTLEEKLGPDLWVNFFYLLSFTYFHVQGIKT